MLSQNQPAIDLQGIRFRWPQQSRPLLEIDQLRIDVGERVFIHGPSGSGKSTLLSLLGGLIRPQQGSVRLLGQPLEAMSASRRDRFRADHMGFIFQQFNLIPYLSPLDNVLLALRFSRRRQQRLDSSDSREEAERLLTALELDPRSLADQPARLLSIGQQQRVAAARALIGGPELIIADEPTSSLDAHNQQRFIDLMFDQCCQQHSSLIFVSHDLRLAERFDRKLALADINAAAPEEALC